MLKDLSLQPIVFIQSKDYMIRVHLIDKVQEKETLRFVRI